jgi:hypothetical protein
VSQPTQSLQKTTAIQNENVFEPAFDPPLIT